MVQLVCTILSICYMVHIVLTRLSIRALLLVEELVHAVVSSWRARLVAVQGFGGKIDRSDLVLQHAEALMGTTQIRTIITCQLLMLLFFN